MADKLLIPCLYLQSGKAVTGFGQRNLFGDGNIENLVRFYRDNGADELLIFDISSGDTEHEQAISNIKSICSAAEIPVMAAGNINRMEDVKKLLYAGCAKVVLNFSKANNISLLEEVSKRFGKEKMAVCISSTEEFTANQALIESFADEVLALDTDFFKHVQGFLGKSSFCKCNSKISHISSPPFRGAGQRMYPCF